MKSEKKQQNTQIKQKKKLVNKQKENELAEKSMNYFRILKALEKQNTKQKLSSELTQKQAKPKKNTLTEIIYENNSKKLENYYNKNQNDLLLYGSSKYDILSMDKLLEEMGNYKLKIINKINENNRYKNIHSDINDIVHDYSNNKVKSILTPLAENEKERSKMEKLEKKKL